MHRKPSAFKVPDGDPPVWDYYYASNERRIDYVYTRDSWKLSFQSLGVTSIFYASAEPPYIQRIDPNAAGAWFLNGPLALGPSCMISFGTIPNPATDRWIYDDRIEADAIEFLFEIYDVSRPPDDRLAPGW